MAEVAAASAPHIVRDSSVTITVTFDADPGATTVAVTNLAGETVKASAAAGTTATATERTVALTGTHTADLDTLTVTWVTTNLGTHTTQHEVVGRFLFSVAEARAFRPNDSGGAPLASTTKYPTATIEDYRADILDEIEQITEQSFVPRYKYERLSGNGSTSLFLPIGTTAIRTLEYRTSGAATFTAFTADELADVYIEPHGEVFRESRGYFTEGRRNYRVGYEWGHTRPPGTVVNAALIMLYLSLVASNVSDRAISISGEVGTEQLFTANISARGRALYSSPEVHRLLGLNQMERKVIA